MSNATKQLEYEQQVRLLLEVLPIVMSDSRFALKGGTAINLFIRDMPRLSVDIDLTYLPIEPRSETIANINGALKRVAEEIARKLKGIKVTPSKAFNSTGELKLLIENAHVMIKVEPNYTLRGSVFKPTQRSLSESCRKKFGAAVDVQIMSHEDIYGGKICAALDRQHPRDLFDVKNLLSNEGLNQKIKTAFLVYLMSHNRPMAELLAPNLKDLTDIYAAEFAEMTVEKAPLEELVEARIQLIKEIHSLITDSDRAFLLSFKSGKPDWSAFELPHIENLPGIQWKLKNIQKLSFIKMRESLAKLEKSLSIYGGAIAIGDNASK